MSAGTGDLPELADCHVHSVFSVDAAETVESVAAAAVGKGIRYLCFTEHVDHNPRDTGYGFFRPSEFSGSVNRARERFDGRIVLLKGIEFSEPNLYPREFEECLKGDYDLVLGSMHYLGQEGFFGERILLERYSREELWSKYFAQMEEMIAFGGFDVLAHFDFPARYYGEGSMPARVCLEVAAKLARRGLGLEINTSGIRKGLNRTLPGEDVVRAFVDAGGRTVTLGSDAHSGPEIGADFESAGKMLDRIGVGPGVFIKRKFRSLIGGGSR